MGILEQARALHAWPFRALHGEGSRAPDWQEPRRTSSLVMISRSASTLKTMAWSRMKMEEGEGEGMVGSRIRRSRQGMASRVTSVCFST
jgi:hypothetical protein